MTAVLDDLATQVPGAPEAELTVAPPSADDAARVLDIASERGAKVLIWGGGEHQGYGGRIEPDIVLSTQRMNRIVDWQPEDLTVVAEAGVPVADLEVRLAERGQTAVLPERPGSATVGGVVAAGVSGWRRLRYGPTRDRMLEVNLVTGDGRPIRGGARVVKNVTGFDLPRLATGSFGGLGLISQVCLKLWPLAPVRRTVHVDETAALGVLYRPHAVIDDNGVVSVYLAGVEGEVEAETNALGGVAVEGHQWPDRFDETCQLVLRVPPSLTGDAVSRVAGSWRYRAQHGVGEVVFGGDAVAADDAAQLRKWAEAQGGSLVISAGPAELYEQLDPWGTPPPALEIQRRLVARFDPVRVINPGRLPGGL